MSPRPLRLGTRASALATSQSGWVADRLRAAGHEVELVPVRTEGDISRASLTEIGGTGVFASALRDALRREEVDLAVHSLKDIPTSAEPGLTIAAVPEREDPRDVLVARDDLTLDQLPDGSVVGTGSPRRAAQLAQTHPGLQVRDIRGNVGTRIAMVRDGELDAVVLARAGLARLDRLADATDILDLGTMLPAPGQAALAVECRDDDTDLIALLQDVLEHEPTRVAITAERTVLAALEAGCTAPIAALARPVDTDPGVLSLHVFVALQNTSQRYEATGTDPVALGHDVAQQLLNQQSLTRPDPTSLAARRSSPEATGGGAFEPEPDL